MAEIQEEKKTAPAKRPARRPAAAKPAAAKQAVQTETPSNEKK